MKKKTFLIYTVIFLVNLALLCFVVSALNKTTNADVLAGSVNYQIWTNEADILQARAMYLGAKVKYQHFLYNPAEVIFWNHQGKVQMSVDGEVIEDACSLQTDSDVFLCKTPEKVEFFVRSVAAPSILPSVEYISFVGGDNTLMCVLEGRESVDFAFNGETIAFYIVPGEIDARGISTTAERFADYFRLEPGQIILIETDRGNYKVTNCEGKKLVGYVPNTDIPNTWQKRWIDAVGIKNQGQDPHDPETNKWYGWPYYLAKLEEVSRSNDVFIQGMFVLEDGNLTAQDMFDEGYKMGLPDDIPYNQPNSPHAVSILVKVDIKGNITGICFYTWNSSWLDLGDGDTGMDKLFYQAFPEWDESKGNFAELQKFVELIVQTAEAR